MNGAGYVAMDWLFCIGALLACVGQFAVLRSPDVRESYLLDGARRVRIVAWGMLCVRSLYVLVNDGDLMVPIFSLVPLLMMAWADVMAAMGRLFSDGGHRFLTTSAPR